MSKRHRTVPCLRENNQAGNFTHTWEYDYAGNIKCRKEYAYTTGNLDNSTPTRTFAYGYPTVPQNAENTVWGDLLIQYGEQNSESALPSITYDAIGNPNAIGDWSFTWKHGRELATMSKGTTTWTNTYNADGLRTERTNGAKTYKYIYSGSTLTQMTVGTDTLFFNYDASGTPLTVTYNGATYYYATNLQGDIVAILNGSGTTVVSYTYDAWGNPLSTTGTMATTLGQQNPLRYRGYVYDQETGLYYLQSRYYNPEIGRFINADGYTSTGQGFSGNNTFVYCGNNPVLFVDSSGTRHEMHGASARPYDPDDYAAYRALQIEVATDGLHESVSDAAIAFSESIYEFSYYTGHEYWGTIYSVTVFGKDYYGYTGPHLGDYHGCIIALDNPSGTIATATIHTHPLSNGFSEEDKITAKNYQLPMYTIGPSRQLLLHDENLNNMPHWDVDTHPITEARKAIFRRTFSASWDAHNRESCVKCGAIRWPQN